MHLVFRNKFKRFASILILAVFMIAGCGDNCNDIIDCNPFQPMLGLRVVSEIDGTDLIFGELPEYEKDDLRLFELNGSDTIFYNYLTEEDFGKEYEGLLYFDQIKTINSRFFLDFNNMDIDTLDVTYDIRESECCGTSVLFNTIHHNGKVVFGLGISDNVTIIEK